MRDREEVEDGKRRMTTRRVNRGTLKSQRRAEERRKNVTKTRADQEKREKEVEEERKREKEKSRKKQG